MRVSAHFKLKWTQASLDFLDVDTQKDTKLFVDPHALRRMNDPWSRRCVALVQSFFQNLLNTIANNDELGAKRLLASLSEPNECHLGLSKGESVGRGMGVGLAEKLWESLSSSRAIQTGLLEDLEDTAILVEGIGPDRISDIIINIIREPLIEYTQRICSYYGIPLTENVDSGPIWNIQSNAWNNDLVNLPMVEHKKLILMPKAIVRKNLFYRVDEYYQHHILTNLQEIELNMGSSLVYLLKDGVTKKVTKKSVKEKYGTGKPVVIAETIKKAGFI